MRLRDPTALIDDLYAGALDDDAWTRASIAVGDHVGATGIHIFAYNPVSNIVTRSESHRIDPRSAALYGNYYFSKDILVEPFGGVVIGEPTPEHRLVTADVWHQSEIYNDLAVPFDTPYLLMTLLHRSPDKIVALSLKTTKNHGPFSSDKADQLRQFVPSIRHVIEIKDRLAALQIRADTLANTLDSVNFGVVVLDEVGRVLELNSVANEIVKARDSGVYINLQRRVEALEPTGKELYRWIIEGKPPDRNFDGFFHVPRSFKLPISLLVSPLPPKTNSWIGGDPRWILLVFDPERGFTVSASLVAQDLSLSTREAEVAALMAIGHDIISVAARLHITTNTVRTHLKSIFSKTGIRSQAELIRKIVQGPASLSPMRVLSEVVTAARHNS